MDIPAPFPTVGICAGLKAAFVRNGSIAIWPLAPTPDFGRFQAARAALSFVKGCRARRKPPSSLTRTRVHPRTDSIFFFEKYFISRREATPLFSVHFCTETVKGATAIPIVEIISHEEFELHPARAGGCSSAPHRVKLNGY